MKKVIGLFRKKRYEYLKNKKALKNKMHNKKATENIIDSSSNLIDELNSKFLLALNWKKIGLRLLFLIVSSVWFAVFPVYIFAIYMYEKGFFSYDFFIDGTIGLKSFFFVSAILTFIVSGYLFGFIVQARYLYVKYITTGRLTLSDRIALWSFLLLSLIFHLIIMIKAFGENKPQIYLSFTVMALIICIYASTFFTFKKEDGITNWIPSAAFIFATFTLPLFNHSNVAYMIDIGLKKFNVGAGKKVAIYDKDSEKPFVEGKLLFWAPEFIYLERSGRQGLELHAYPTKTATHIVVER